MAQFKALDPQAEVRGDVVSATINVMGAFKAIAEGILADHGIEDPGPNQWFPLQAWLSSFQTIATQVGPNTVYQIGRQIPRQGYYPPGIESIEDVLTALNQQYQLCHRGGQVGTYEFSFTGSRSGKLVCNTPYPCDFDRGLIESLTQRFEPEDSFVDVQHDDSVPCKKLGADSCSYRISW